MSIKQLSVFIENKWGRLAEITKVLADENINIRAMSVADTSDFGILRMIVDQPEKAVESFQKNNMTLTVTTVIGVGISDKPGAFAKVVKVLTDANIEIEYLYDYNSRNDEELCIILRVNDEENAVKVLNDNNIKMLSAEQVYRA